MKVLIFSDLNDRLALVKNKSELILNNIIRPLTLCPRYAN